jgi:hypothetical protein
VIEKVTALSVLRRYKFSDSDDQSNDCNTLQDCCGENMHIKLFTEKPIQAIHGRSSGCRDYLLASSRCSSGNLTYCVGSYLIAEKSRALGSATAKPATACPKIEPNAIAPTVLHNGVDL